NGNRHSSASNPSAFCSWKGDRTVSCPHPAQTRRKSAPCLANSDSVRRFGSPIMFSICSNEDNRILLHLEIGRRYAPLWDFVDSFAQRRLKVQENASARHMVRWTRA